jgi:hypothetical protein
MGGIAAMAGGGSFGEGALTASFAYLFNYLQHGVDVSKQDGALITDKASDWEGTPYKLVGPASEIQIGGDCSGSTFKIYDSAGDHYTYVRADDFGAAADKEGFPFRRLGAGESLQSGDVLQFKGHMAVYAGQDSRGRDMMWTATHTGGNPYEKIPVKSWGKPVVGQFRYQNPGE